MQKKVLAAAISALFVTNAYSQNVVIENEFIKAGVNEITGTLGSGHRTPPGLQYDSTGTRTFSDSFDYLTPGNPFEGYTVHITDSSGSVLQSYTNNNSGNLANILGGIWVGTPSASSVIWAASTPEFNIQHSYSLPSMQTYIDITTRIDALVAMPRLYFGRFIDPDTRTAAGDSSSTDNALGYGAIPTRNVVFSEAIVSRAALGLYSASPVVGAGISPTWSTNPIDYYTGGSYTVGRGDHTIGIGFLVENVSPGDIVTFQYAYIFGPNAFGAASGAISGGAAGGTPGSVPGGGTLTDVGSATDAAGTPAPSSPTLVSSTTTEAVNVTEAVITSLPVITGSITHHTASEASGVQTIARQTTTAVTTPWLRTTTTTPVTVATYSDGSTTTTTGSAVVSEELFNKVDLSESNDSLSGRIDQHDNLAQLNRGLNRGLNVNAFRRDAVCADTKKASDECRESVRVFANGSLATSGMSNGYSADTKLYGLGFDFAVTSNWRLGAQVNRVSTKMAGVDSLTQQNKDHYGVYSIYNISGFTVVNNFGYASDAINSNRNIEGVFENSHSVNGRSKWVQNRIYSPNLLGMNPFVGYSWGRAERNAYVENGSIQSARAVDAVKGSTSFSEAGVRFGHSFGKLSLAGEASVASDGFKVVDAAVSYSVNQNSILSVGASRQVGNDIGTNVVSVRGLVRF